MPDYDGGDLSKKVAYLERPGELLTGARIVRRPSCQGTEGFMLMVQKVRPSDAATAPSSPADNKEEVTSESIKIKPKGVGYAQVNIDSWSIVF